MVSPTPTMLLTLPMLVTVSRTAMVQSVLRMMVAMLLTMTVPTMATGAGIHATRLGDPLRGRALRCNLRFAPISAAIPVASVRFAHCALRLPGGSLRSPPSAGPIRSWSRSTASAASPPCPPRHGAARRARRGTRFARPGRLRRLRASPRLVAVALRASPVPASPRTGLRTAPCSRARTSADTSARAFGSVLRTTACGSGRGTRHSIAVAAPLRRLRRHRFPHRSCCLSVHCWTPEAVGSHTPRSALLGLPWVSMSGHFRDFRRLRAPGDCWTERVTLRILPRSASCRRMPPPDDDRFPRDHAALHGPVSALHGRYTPIAPPNTDSQPRSRGTILIRRASFQRSTGPQMAIPAPPSSSRHAQSGSKNGVTACYRRHHHRSVCALDPLRFTQHQDRIHDR